MATVIRSTPRPRQIMGLDLVRFSAAFMVMAFHMTGTGRYAATARWGWVGVEIFFVLSGFVIAYTAAEASASKFLRNRIVRLMPSVWLCGSITALIFLVNGGLPSLGWRYLATMTLWPTGPWVDASYWTLPVEVFFYTAVFALLVLGIFSRIEAFAAVLATTSTLYLSARLISIARPYSVFALVNAVTADFARLSGLDYGSYFALGVVLWLIFCDRATPTRWAIVGIAMAGGVLQIAFAARGFSRSAPIIEPEAVWLTALVAISLSAWQAPAIATIAGRFAGTARLLGLATYPLYLLHDDMGVLMRNAFTTVMPLPLAIILTCVTFVAVAFVVAKWAEPTLQRPLRWVLSLIHLPRRRMSPLPEST